MMIISTKQMNVSLFRDIDWSFPQSKSSRQTHTRIVEREKYSYVTIS